MELHSATSSHTQFVDVILLHALNNIHDIFMQGFLPLLFAKRLTEEFLLNLPHRQFVFIFPNALQPFFRIDSQLFADVSRLIFSILKMI